MDGKGRWVSMILKQPKKGQGAAKGIGRDDDEGEAEASSPKKSVGSTSMLNSPNLTVPSPRYNAMLAVLRNTLYMLAFFVLSTMTHRCCCTDTEESTNEDPKNTRWTTFTRFS
jgi:hypothetical protein